MTASLEFLIILSVLTAAHTDGFLARDYEEYPIRYFVTRYGYPYEAHANVTTEDGYLLNMYRIPFGIVRTFRRIREPVLLVHGLSSSCEDFVVTGPDRGLGFLLAEAGYDVWLGNTRGNIHSRKHVRYNAGDDGRYWAFSFHEIGFYDLPAMISHIQNVTGRDEVFYVGHSQGTTAFFVMLATRPEMNASIRMMVALAPAVYMSNIPHPILRSVSNHVDILSQLFDNKEFVHITPQLEVATRSLCSLSRDSLELCANVIFSIAGNNSLQLDRSLVSDILRFEPAGSSTRQMLHFLQEVRSGRFCRYDFGPMRNMIIYGTMLPPAYDLSKVSVPVGIYCAQNDVLVSIKDVVRLSRELPYVIRAHRVNYAVFTHLDFVYANDVVPLVYQDVMDLMEGFR